MDNEQKLRDYLKRATVDLRESRQRVQELEERAHEPIAIVGMACRLPGGVTTPQELWELLSAGRDAVGPFPQGRGWDLEKLYDPDPARLGTSYCREGGFLYEADRFDAEFFGISPREAAAMDPQQRLLLETGWEAFEHAGIDPTTLRGTRTGVYAGVMYDDYGSRTPEAPEEFEGYLLTGSAGSIASGRLSYTFGLEGPAVTVDTACSSSLVALHLAARSLRQGECSMALAGGVTVMATPGTFVEFSRQRGLAPDGRCKAFSSSADGTGWAEGVGVLVLERLSDAQRNGHRVLAVLRGSAVNQDGASSQLTAPNGPAQERVIRAALADARLAAADVDAVEAHGTGTRLGDPIEARALVSAYGTARGEDHPLWLGSLKSNIGHTQAAAGVAGVIKMVMAMRAGVLPPTLHVAEPTSEADWSAGTVRLLTEAQPWPELDRPRRTGVSSFGISGTNAHVILEEAPRDGAPAAPQTSARPSTPPAPWLLSARSESALRAQAGRLLAWLADHPEAADADIAAALSGTRAQLGRRGAVLGADRAALLAGLTALAAGEDSPQVVSDAATTGETAFLFTGQGAQRAGMGAGLAAAFPVFAAALDEVCGHFDALLGVELRAIMFGGSEGAGDSADASGRTAPLDRTEYTQPALFAFEVALYRLLESFGVTPDVVVGHSIGELAAAYVAGVWSLPDACRLVAARGRLMGALPSGGAMLAAALPQERAREIAAAGTVSLAAVNAPAATVFSGASAEIAALQERLTREGVKTHRLTVSHAFHSALMEPMFAEYEQVAGSVAYRAPRIDVCSTVTGAPAGPELLTPRYWVRQVREAVLFAPAVGALADAGVRRFVEVGPDAVLAALTRQTLTDEVASRSLVAAAARRTVDEAEQFLRLLAAAHCSGAAVDWTPLAPEGPAAHLDLPGYAFQHRSYWVRPDEGALGDLGRAGLAALDHPMLRVAAPLAGRDAWLFSGRLSTTDQPWLSDHAAFGSVLLPGTGFVDLALAAGRRLDLPVLDELVLSAPLLFDGAAAVDVQLSVTEADHTGRRRLSVHSRTATGATAPDPGEPEWTLHATGTLAPADDVAPAWTGPDWPPADGAPVDAERLYDRLTDLGFGYGPGFQGVRAAWTRGDEVFTEVALDETTAGRAAGFGVHPALLDATFHAVIDVLAADLPDGELPLPFSFGGVRLYRPGATAVRARIIRSGPEKVRIDACDATGAAVLSIDAVLARPAQARALAGARSPLYALDWTALPAAAAAPRRLVALGRPVAGCAETYADAADFAARGGEPGAAVLWTPRTSPADGADVPAAVRAAVHDALAVLRDWLSAPGCADATLTVLTRNAAGLPGETPDPAAAAVRGLVRSAQSEHPGRIVTLDLDAGDPTGLHQHIAAALATDEPQLALRGAALLAPRLTWTTTAAPAGKPFGEGTVLITGGAGGLAAVTAHHLVTRHGVRDLLLVSRRGADAPGVGELVAELTGLGAAVRVAACDVSDRAAVGALLASVPEHAPVTAVVHTAGVVDDGTVETLTAEQVDRVLAPKVDAAWHLHELTRDLDLSAFVLFSSAGPLLGGAGQGNYAAANAAMDALAQARRSAGLPAHSLAWGLWKRGMAEALNEPGGAHLVRRIRTRLGLSPIEPDTGMQLFDAALHTGDPLLMTAVLDTPALTALARLGTLPALLRGLIHLPARGRAGDSPLRTRLLDAPAEQWEALIRDEVRAIVAGVLGHESGDAIDPETPFTELGFDSLGGVEFRNKVTAATGVPLPSTLVFDYPTAAAVAGFLRTRVDDAEPSRPRPAPARPRTTAPADEPIAIVGMSCRYPGGADTPDQLWELIEGRVDAITPIPDDRGWDVENLYDTDPGKPGRIYSREGGFLPAAGDFDAAFFGIGPREAAAMDPQQRLLLEASWEALEDAGIDPTTLRGSDTGVYAGVMYQDYGYTAREAADGAADGYLATGSAGSVVSGRVSYALGLEGPAMTVDTACSSSLVALHLAVQALRAGETSLVLASGVTVMSTPLLFLEFSRQRALSPDGRCKAFANGADGVSWAEGVGVLALERLSDARRNGRPVLAVIRGSAVNQDGASNGLTAPNGPSQERVIAQALSNAGVSAAEVDAVEAHGTGTTLGDPIEAQALINAYGQDRAEPLRIGSLKSNIGHTQAAAGVGGVIKMVQALRHETLPSTLHVDAPSPHVDWSAGAVRILTEAEPWPATERPRRAGVSSFGISGTNAHVILEEAPPAPPRPAAPTRPAALPLLLSAKTPAALRAQAHRLHDTLRERPELDLTDVAVTLAQHRARLDQRAAVVGQDRETLLAALARLAADEQGTGLIDGVGRTGTTAFLFTGQGAQRAGMGTELYRAFPAFAAALDEVCAHFDAELEHPLRDVMSGATAEPLLDRTEYAQPALFAFEVALYRLVESLGVVPDAVAGHSVGELAAAHVAGVWSLPDACRLVAARGRLMGALPAGGSMLAAAVPEARALELLAADHTAVSLAAVNAPDAVVFSGDGDAVAALEATLAAEGVRTSRLRVSHAFHSASMDPMLPEFARIAAELTYHEPRLPLCSTVSGAVADEAMGTPAYWVRQVRETVRFAPAVRSLLDSGVRLFVELGPDAVLTTMTRATLAADPATHATAVAGSRRTVAEPEQLVTALATADCAGRPVRWTEFFGARPRTRTTLPTYPFQHERFWLRPAEAVAPLAGADSAGHPLLHTQMQLAGTDEWLFTGRLSTRTHPWLAVHTVFGTAVAPATALVELALAAGARLGVPRLAELAVEAPLILPADGGADLQLTVGAPDADGHRPLTVHSRAGDTWAPHARGLLAPAAPAAAPDWSRAWPPAGDPLDVAELYRALGDLGFGYGPAFQGVRAAWTRGDEIFADLALDPGTAAHATDFGVHPALLDAVFHATAGRLAEDGPGDRVPLPSAFDGVQLDRSGAGAVRARVTRVAPDTFRVEAVDAAGAPVLTMDTVRVRPVEPRALAQLRGAPPLFDIEWTAVPTVPGADTGRLVVLGDPAAVEAAEPPASRADLADLPVLRDAPDTVVWPAPRRTGAGAADVHDGVLTTLRLLQRWISAEHPGRLVILTRTSAGLPGEEPDLVGAAVAGLVRSAQSEHPGRFLLIDQDGDALPVGTLAAALAQDEPHLAVRGGRLLAPRLRPLPVTRPEAPLPLGRGTVLITGGTGGIGAIVARHLVAAHGARRLLLVSRRGGAAEGAAGLAAELTGLGAHVRVEACDVTDRGALQALLAGIDADAPLTAVVHAAGVLADGTLDTLTAAQTTRVLAPKADAALHLHELTRHLELSAFVLFSSAAPMLGGQGQGNYAAANSVLDALARVRRSAGLPAHSLAWGLWTVGMAEALSGDGAEQYARQIRTRLGLVPIDEEAGTALFDQALASDRATPTTALLDTAALTALARGGTLPAVLRDLVRVPPAAARAGLGLARQLAAGSDADAEAMVLREVRTVAASVLGHPSGDAVDPNAPFTELGFDSLSAVEFRNRLAQLTGLTFPPTLVFDQPTVADVAKLVRSRIEESETGVAEQPPAGARGTITDLVSAAHRRGELAGALPLLTAGSALMTTYSAAEAGARRPAVQLLARGATAPALICLPSFLAGSGTHQFARLARELGGERQVSAVRLPGTRAGDDLPATWEAAIASLAATVAAELGRSPVALVGYSAGGALAHAVARRLEDDGHELAGVAMIDTYSPQDADLNRRVLTDALGQILSRDNALTPVDDHALVAMGGYVRIYAERAAEPITAPTLNLRATQTLSSFGDVAPVPGWQHRGPVEHVEGDHFSIVEEKAAQTAAHLRRWLDSLGGH
ncbi:type I polyketide synthase [Streptomyces sp. NPDC006552]|uniref:type I polyketide synthase n=1 Tax=Streptomyces sp. NPDC006552 TaxID=3157179 RepID=UPI0033A301EB